MSVPRETIDRLRRIQKLATEGATEGERQTAAGLLERLLGQYGLTEADLSSPVKRVAIRTRNDHGVLVAAMVFRHMFDQTGEIPIWRSKKSGYTVFDAPADRADEFEAEATRHVRAFFRYVEKQMRTLVEGYVARNQLYPASGEAVEVDTATMSADALMAWAMRQAATQAAPSLPAAKSRQIETK